MEKQTKIMLIAGSACAALGIVLFVFRKNITTAAMIFSGWVTQNTQAFLAKVQSIASQLDIKADWLMAVMAIESGLQASITNSIGATGLIQFMPATAAALGTSTAALRAMSNVQQLDYVYKYLSNYKSKLKSAGDLYLTIFYPAAVGKADTYVIGAAGSAIATQNPALRNSAGAVTVGSVKNNFLNWVKAKGFTLT
jgi:hypothetical protein